MCRWGSPGISDSNRKNQFRAPGCEQKYGHTRNRCGASGKDRRDRTGNERQPDHPEWKTDRGSYACLYCGSFARLCHFCRKHDRRVNCKGIPHGRSRMRICRKREEKCDRNCLRPTKVLLIIQVVFGIFVTKWRCFYGQAEYSDCR